MSAPVPLFSTPSAGLPDSIASTEVVGTSVLIDGLRLLSVRSPLKLALTRIAQNSTNAISRFIPGPARITTIRFHGGWLQ